MQLKENDKACYRVCLQIFKNNPILIDFEINMLGMNEVIPYDKNLFSLDWNMKTPNIEKRNYARTGNMVILSITRRR